MQKVPSALNNEHASLQSVKIMNWIKQWPWVLLVLSLVVSIATGIPGIRGLGEASKDIAWFHVSVFSAVAFIFIGAAQYVRDALLDLKDHVEVKEKPLRDAIATVEQVANNMRGDVRCEFAGDDEAATQYVCSKCYGDNLIGIQGTLVRLEDMHSCYSSETYKGIVEAMRSLLSRSDTFIEEVVGSYAEKRMVDAYVSGAADAEKSDPNRVAWYRLNEETPILNFVILTFRQNGTTERFEEVLFGGSRYANDSNEAVFKSRDSRVVQQFKDLHMVLRKSSVRVPASGLRDHFERSAASGISIEDKWAQAKLYSILNQTEPSDENASNGTSGDLRILTTFFIDYFGLREDVLIPLQKKGVKVKVLLMDPDNSALMQARFGLRQDGLGFERAQGDLLSDLRSLSTFPNIEVRVTDSMPCGFVAHSKERVVLGIMPSHASYVVGPMIESCADSRLWRMLEEDWNIRWNAAKAYSLSKSP